MDKEKISRLEKLLNRELAAEEMDRFDRIQNTLAIKNNDTLWDIVIALEYHRKFYDELPEKIAATSAEIFQGLSEAAEKEVAKAQGLLAESVVKQAEELSLKTHLQLWFLWGTLVLALFLKYGGLLLWARYGLGSGQTQPPALLMKMPLGIVIGVLCLCSGIFSGVLAGQDFSEGNAKWRKRSLLALGCLLPGGWALAVTLI